MSLQVDAAYTSFFRAEYPRVKRTVYLIVRDVGLAEDISQEAFVQLLDHWKKVSKYERPDAWVRRIAIRIAVRSLRRERLRRETESTAAFEPPSTSTETDLSDAIRQLPPAQKAAIVLFYYEDRPVMEIAEILECATSTAKVHLHKGRTRLASLLRREFADAQ